MFFLNKGIYKYRGRSFKSLSELANHLTENGLYRSFQYDYEKGLELKVKKASKQELVEYEDLKENYDYFLTYYNHKGEKFLKKDRLIYRIDNFGEYLASSLRYRCNSFKPWLDELLKKEKLDIYYSGSGEFAEGIVNEIVMKEAPYKGILFHKGGEYKQLTSINVQGMKEIDKVIDFYRSQKSINYRIYADILEGLKLGEDLVELESFYVANNMFVGSWALLFREGKTLKLNKAYMSEYFNLDNVKDLEGAIDSIKLEACDDYFKTLNRKLLLELILLGEGEEVSQKVLDFFDYLIKGDKLALIDDKSVAVIVWIISNKIKIKVRAKGVYDKIGDFFDDEVYEFIGEMMHKYILEGSDKVLAPLKTILSEVEDNKLNQVEFDIYNAILNREFKLKKILKLDRLKAINKINKKLFKVKEWNDLEELDRFFRYNQKYGKKDYMRVTPKTFSSDGGAGIFGLFDAVDD